MPQKRLTAVGRVAARVVADVGDFGGERGEGGGGAAVDAEGYAHGGGDADGHGAADDHVADDGGDLFVVGGEDVGLFVGELGLIEEVDAFRKPFEGGNHVLYQFRRLAGGCEGMSAAAGAVAVELEPYPPSFGDRAEEEIGRVEGIAAAAPVEANAVCSTGRR